MALDRQVHQELLTLLSDLSNSGKLPARRELDRYYATFREKFGPEALRNLDGEVLLETMHGTGNYDSMVYWLEFKVDDEMPVIFGSIAGGSALKFGIYRRKETGVWMTGSPQKQQELSVSEAVDIVRGYRDQLLRGVALLAALPANGSDDDYHKLQEEMNRVAPDVSGTAWGHKYFHMIFPDKLDDYHQER